MVAGSASGTAELSLQQRPSCSKWRANEPSGGANGRTDQMAQRAAAVINLVTEQDKVAALTFALVFANRFITEARPRPRQVISQVNNYSPFVFKDSRSVASTRANNIAPTTRKDI